MNDLNKETSNAGKHVGGSLPKQNIVIERTYRATAREVWDLWTTKDGFESWWGPEGFRVEVHALDARIGGRLHYDMIADTPEHVAAMKKMGQATSHSVRGTFSAFAAMDRLELTQTIDFVPGVTPYDSVMGVELFAKGDQVRMVISLSPMHSEEFSKMQQMGFTSQLTKLDKRFAK